MIEYAAVTSYRTRDDLYGLAAFQMRLLDLRHSTWASALEFSNYSLGNNQRLSSSRHKASYARRMCYCKKVISEITLCKYVRREQWLQGGNLSTAMLLFRLVKR